MDGGSADAGGVTGVLGVGASNRRWIIGGRSELGMAGETGEAGGSPMRG